MATGNQAAWRVMQSHLAAMGYLEAAVIGEPMAPPEPVTAAIIPISVDVDETTLTQPREVHTVALRFYADGLAEDREAVEFLLDQIRADIQKDIFGDFTLGGEVAYALPTRFAARWGWQGIASRMYRMLDLTVAYRIDERATFTP